ncbi:ParB/RepB/Spo0J family partition protein [Pararhodobacter aggregans]|uniref:Chromosome partitioning protein ParB n=2 Tax=Pararhodobacter aggregans TaxID=404875 RepID=A0A2T7UMD2_9RHOB|nr:ParB N-terminal domain-containing protein [Pararhodobacter aggregans]PVE45862.1 chromosome partitioning protein ParB [Pararhodobacter aggregans]
MTPRLMTIDRVKVEEIDTKGRLRPVSEAGVAALMASIDETGVMKDAIHVRQKKNGTLALIAGGHRLEAAKRLGWAEIEAKVWTDVTDDWSRLMEIDDNIAGAELNPLDTALFLAERKRVYEKLHPEAKRGVAGAAARWDATDTMSVASFADATAEKFGLSQRHIFRLIAAGTRLDARDVALLRKAPRPITLKDLAEIAKISQPTDRYEVVEALAEGRAKSAAEARRAIAASEGSAAPVEDPVEAGLKALKTAWSRAPKEARRRFCRDHGDEISALLFEGSPE